MEEITLNASRENELAVFDERVNALIESKYILADKRIASLLKGIVSGSYLMSVVEESLKTFSYATEFARNRLLVSDGDGVKARMTLPVDKVRLFTFVFCLLADIDAGKRDFTKFLTEYFGEETANDSFRRFCGEIIVPFKKAGESLLKDTDSDAQEKEEERKGALYFGAETVYISAAVTDAVSSACARIKTKLDKDFQGGGEQRAECMELVDAFLNAVMSRNPKLIRIVWTGLKYTLRSVRGFEREIAAVKNVLVDGNLI